MTTEWYKKHRPQDFKSFVGNAEAVKTISSKIKANTLQHTILLTGPSGCGKTSTARIICTKLGVNKHDLVELNAASARGIDTVRDICRSVQFRPMAGKARAWIIDEAHQLTADAQDSFLKTLEDTPAYAYFILCTTDPRKLKATVKTRCTEVKLAALNPTEMKGLLAKVAEAEEFELTAEVSGRIVEIAEGSARRALVLLEQISPLGDEETQLNALQKAESREESIALARALFNAKTQWTDVAKIIKNTEEDPEVIRQIVLSYFTTVATSGKISPRIVAVLDAFQYDFFQSKKAGLVLACYKVLNAR